MELLPPCAAVAAAAAAMFMLEIMTLEHDESSRCEIVDSILIVICELISIE